MLRDIRKGTPRVVKVAARIAELNADILVLGDIDYDHDGAALTALRDAIPDGAARFPHLFAERPNSGIPTGLDLNGDGRAGAPGDAQGYGRFPGQGGLAVLSRWPLTLTADHSSRLWRNVPDSLLIDVQGRLGAAATGADIQRLSTVAHWEVAVHLPRGALTLMVFHAAPPVFDGPEDRNGRRNADELSFWRHRLDGAFGPPPEPPFLVVGTANLDPHGGDGRQEVMRAFLADPRILDPPGLTDRPTVNWPPPGPGALRVDYLLPSSGLSVDAAGVLTADPEASRHHPIWIDLWIGES
ncbi:hypothetical protein OB2597_13858 [Pseudooceanicola batsensis HTCC2597]|uniref:Endonuclease/exonuclease/phosphatase domain-containing protein n=1 Tax=Pseudooceanicola batsensis (strain ATCC BAA-863 / DSM 15984 / KCTC 12145 / HTCC2597) TaxID=252305 RepID=A3TYK0_PSEBH|nr:endonuclease/exonuclease/phosphatase family protein [Pseudooceanicola batsensis]EAQ03234.1 hypothetical protein OB2597_13858 [Pseudooceanicola batsensis HTCC2597]